MLSVSVRLENSARSFVKPSPDDDIFFHGNGGFGPGPGWTVAVSAIRPDPGDLLLPHPAADEAPAEEGPGVPGLAQGRGQDRDHERDLWADHQSEREVAASADRRQGAHRS